MQLIHERCCGIDVHSKTVVACLRTPDDEGGRRGEVRTFGTTTAELLKLLDWLVEAGCTHVAMESTGVYWKPVFNLLEGSVEVILVNAQHVKALPGRKTDVKDCEWLAQLLEFGLLRASFIPPLPIRELRELTRYRKTLIQERAREANRLQKFLESANIKLGNVASDVLGVSGRAMLKRLIAGERDPGALANLARGRLREKRDDLREALTGRFTEHHGFLIQRILDHVEFLDKSIEECNRRLEERTRPFADNIDRLCSIPGVAQHGAECILAEIGADMSQFPSDLHLASWASICPGNKQSAGKRISGKIRQGNRWLRQILVECAWAATRTRGTYLSAQYARLVRRRGKKRALIAVGHSILVSAYHMLRDSKLYSDLGAAYFDRREKSRLTRYHLHRLEELGHKVTIEPLREVA